MWQLCRIVSLVLDSGSCVLLARVAKWLEKEVAHLETVLYAIQQLPIYLDHVHISVGVVLAPEAEAKLGTGDSESGSTAVFK